ncbi:hypothetical protein ACFSTH_09310 [Paenibacillus yanchengensis]|uniref:Uncharacterized protein n=1 Tax=Paenibacillus yanchengensis TaxID=2035833 RepID=A0ABW4YGE5_9BACL
MELTREEVNTICKGDQEIARFVHALLEQNQQLTALVERIRHTVQAYMPDQKLLSYDPTTTRNSFIYFSNRSVIANY